MAISLVVIALAVVAGAAVVAVAALRVSAETRKLSTMVQGYQEDRGPGARRRASA